MENDKNRRISINEDVYDDESDEESNRRLPKNLTMRYDMGTLRKLTELDENYRKTLAKYYKCEDDDGPLEIDFMEVYAMNQSERQLFLVDRLIYHLP